jgi:hypothetical protein
MKAVLAAVVLIFVAFLPACKTGFDINLVNQIIQDCKTACSFVPTIQSISGLITTDPTVATVGAAVALICSAFNNLPADIRREYKAGKVVTFAARTSNGDMVQITGKVTN